MNLMIPETHTTTISSINSFIDILREHPGLPPEPFGNAITALATKGRLIIRQDFTPEYQNYLQSERWKHFCSWVKEKRNYTCEHCGSSERLQVHHKTYVRLGQELLSDVLCVCRECHETIHNRRFTGSGYIN